MTERVKRAFAAKAMMIALGVLLAPIPTVRAQPSLAAKCNGTANIGADDRIAGCTAVIEAAPGNLQGTTFAYFRRAMFLLEKGEVDRAIADYTHVIERDPNNQIAFVRRAWAYQRKGDVDAALADFGRAVELNPKDAYAYLGRAGAYIMKGDADRAIADYGQVVLIHPDNVAAYLGRAQAYDLKREPDRAIADCNRAIEISPERGAGAGLICRARVRITNGDFALGLADLNQAIQFNPKDAGAYLTRAAAYLMRRDIDSAIADYSQVIALHPDNVDAYTGRGRAYDFKDEPDRAIVDCDRAIAIGGPRGAAAGLVCRGHAHVAKGDFELASADFDQVIQLSPKASGPYEGRAAVFLARGDLERALADIKQGIQLAPDAPGLYRLAAVAHFQGGLLQEARDDLVRAGELDRKNPYTQLWLDLVRQKTGQPSGLDEASGRLDLSNWPAPIVRLFLGATTLEDVVKAADDANPVKMRGQLCEAHFYGGELALAKGATDEAVRLLRLAADGCPKTYVEWAPANAELRKLDTRH
ncbi:tetratricopeptide repeat protein [Bradyrhizobium sp. Pha-3]|uniref:tetratricopeptide repeat protein n=1 Tax=Bradyrhizobium sp. Pha-3 TaxID=208375 RepID=UPI0035D4A79A